MKIGDKVKLLTLEATEDNVGEIIGIIPKTANMPCDLIQVEYIDIIVKYWADKLEVIPSKINENLRDIDEEIKLYGDKGDQFAYEEYIWLNEQQ